MSARIIIVCDTCKATSPPATTHRHARLAHRWTNPHRGADYCPDCSAARKARHDAELAKLPKAYRGYF